MGVPSWGWLHRLDQLISMGNLCSKDWYLKIGLHTVDNYCLFHLLSRWLICEPEGNQLAQVLRGMRVGRASDWEPDERRMSSNKQANNMSETLSIRARRRISEALKQMDQGIQHLPKKSAARDEYHLRSGQRSWRNEKVGGMSQCTNQVLMLRQDWRTCFEGRDRGKMRRSSWVPQCRQDEDTGGCDDGEKSL